MADYPFTTLVPNLGVVRFSNELSYVVADIPGLISGAHKGSGLGLQFLRHVERTRVFVHLIDATGSMGVSPIQAYKDIRKELELYDQDNIKNHEFVPLSQRYEIVALTKIDAVTEEDLESIAEDFLELGIEVRRISSVTGENIAELVKELGTKVFEQNE